MQSGGGWGAGGWHGRCMPRRPQPVGCGRGARGRGDTGGLKRCACEGRRFGRGADGPCRPQDVSRGDSRGREVGGWQAGRRAGGVHALPPLPPLGRVPSPLPFPVRRRGTRARGGRRTGACTPRAGGWAGRVHCRRGRRDGEPGGPGRVHWPPPPPSCPGPPSLSAPGGWLELIIRPKFPGIFLMLQRWCSSRPLRGP